MNRTFQPVDDDPAAGLSQCTAVCFTLIPQRVMFRGNNQGIRLIGQILFQQRRGIWVIPVVGGQVEFPVFAQPFGSQNIVLPFSRMDSNGEVSGEWSL